MVEYGFSIMGFLRSCAIGYHWKAFKKMVKLLDQITDWKIHFAFFNLQPCIIVLQKLFEFANYWNPIFAARYKMLKYW